MKNHGQKTATSRRRKKAQDQRNSDIQGSAKTKDDSEQAELEDFGTAF